VKGVAEPDRDERLRCRKGGTTVDTSSRARRSVRVTMVVGVVMLLTVFAGAGAGAATPGSAAAHGSNAASTAVAGCGDSAVTDPTDISVGRKPARCDAGAPAPKPLSRPVTLTVSSSFKLEFIAPLLVGDALGEFKKENININLVNVTFSDAVPQLASGQIDVAVGGIEGALFNAARQGLPVKMVLGNYFPPDAGKPSVPQTGMWCRRDAFKTPNNPKPAELKGKKVGSAVGKASVSFYYVQQEIRGKFKATDLDIQTIPSTDMVQAMKNQALDCAILLDPLWLQVSNDPSFVLVATQTPGEPLGGYFYGKNLLQDRRNVGAAFARAMIRTINTYLTGDYHQNQQTMDAISNAINQPVATIQRTPPLQFDWEIRNGTAERVQKVFIDLGVLTFKKPVSDKKVFDRSLYLKAVGKS
jgi:NitT/TauT family transport system substrate-binding protein